MNLRSALVRTGLLAGAAIVFSTITASAAPPDRAAAPTDPAACSSPATPASATPTQLPVTVWLAGDSTMAAPSGGATCPVGWGHQFAQYFNSNVTVKNSAVAGRSIQTWLYDPNVTSRKNSAGECIVSPVSYSSRWRAMLDAANGMKAGDYLLIQFGINDGDSRCPRHVGSARYRELLGVMASAAKARGAHPVFLTPVAAITCSGSTAVGNRGFISETNAAATANQVPVIDLHRLSYTLYNSLRFCPNNGDYGSGPVGAFFCNDHTHFEAAGARQIAGVVAKALRDQQIPLSAYLKPLAAIGAAAGGVPPSEAADRPPNPLRKPGWILDRNDEFNGTLDRSLWITNYLESRTPWWRSAARYGFRNNALVLRIDNDQPTYYAGDPMKVSSLQTGQRVGLHKNNSFDHSIPTIMKYTAMYGYFEIRAKTSGRSGLHAAFWMVGKQDTSSQSAEVDIVEHAGRSPRNFNFGMFKWGDPNAQEIHHSIGVDFDLASEMHIYALERTPTQMRLYVDDVLKKTMTVSPGYPMVFLLGIYENAGWTGPVDPSDSRPKEFVVDYFRSYRKSGTK